MLLPSQQREGCPVLSGHSGSVGQAVPGAEDEAGGSVMTTGAEELKWRLTILTLSHQESALLHKLLSCQNCLVKEGDGVEWDCLGWPGMG